MAEKAAIAVPRMRTPALCKRFFAVEIGIPRAPDPLGARSRSVVNRTVGLEMGETALASRNV